jgi:hypothetical protein
MAYHFFTFLNLEASLRLGTFDHVLSLDCQFAYVFHGTLLEPLPAFLAIITLLSKK